MGLVEDAGLETFHTTIGCTLKQTNEILNHNLSRVTLTSEYAHAIRNNAIKIMKKFPDSLKQKWDAKFQRIKTIETELYSFIHPESDDIKMLQEDATGQLSFGDEYFKYLNGMPFVLMCIALFKIWAVPALAVSTPIFAWILPYIFLKFLYKLPISQQQYTEIMKLIWAGNPFSFKKDMAGGVKLASPSTMTLRSFIQTAVMVFSFIQSLVQPVQTAMHLYKTDALLYSNGVKCIELLTIYNEMKSGCDEHNIIFQSRNSFSTIYTDDPRRTIHMLLEEPERFKILMRDFAELEILWRISQSSLLHEATIFESGAPLFQVTNAFDISLGLKAVPSSVEFTGEKNHAALTGPNGGGKSSFLRSILQCAILAQSYGIAPAEKVNLRRFAWISSGLRLQDAPGNLSMFETEVWFASNLLRRDSVKGPGLVLYDELFHSTNPPDGIKTAEIFLKRLWERDSVISIISTHVFHLVENAPNNVKKICCKAIKNRLGKVQYKYNVEEGICRLSSVKSIWERFSL